MTRYFVRTTNSQSGGWNGTYGFHTRTQAVRFAKNHVATYPGATARIHFVVRCRRINGNAYLVTLRRTKVR